MIRLFTFTFHILEFIIRVYFFSMGGNTYMILKLNRSFTSSFHMGFPVTTIR